MTAPTVPAGTLRELADLLEVRGAVRDAAALRRAADARTGPTPRGIGPFAASLLKEITSGEPRRALQRARAGVPAAIGHLLDAGVLSPSEASQLVRQAAVVTVTDLGPALDDGRVARQMGESIARRLAAYLESADPPAIPLGRAADLADELRDEIVRSVPGLAALEPAGDVRRFEALVSGIVLVGRADDPSPALDAIAAMPGVRDVLHRTARRLLFPYRQLEVDIRIAAPDEHGSVLFAATGSRAHYRGMLARRTRAALRAREEQVYADSGLPWIPPELREGTGEIEAAAAGRLPALVGLSDIRGDLHMHSTYSDGRDSLEAMVDACRALGYEYIAITDHSQGAGASRTLAEEEIPRQRDEIARLRDRHAGMTILHGVEVDILADGRLDFPDAVLERFDIVLASLHDRAGHDGGRLTKRCLAAIRHPLVNIIAHPENRLVGYRDGFPLDFETIYAAAAETGTALEIDGAPGHLDLDGTHARAAAQAGVVLAIDSDCHRAAALGRQMQLGIGTARRGWIGPQQVLNTRPIQDVLAFVAAGRRR